MPVDMTIIGLGQIGASFGLALGKYKEQIKRGGIDREPITAERALKRGAVDKLYRNLQSSAENADVILLAVPPDELRETLEIIAPVLKEGAVVLDTSPIQETAIRWAHELFKGERHFVSIYPTLNPLYLNETATGIDASHDDLFKNSLIAISCGSGTHADALRLAADLTAMVEASTYFSDAVEVDGLLASGDLLPRLASVALVLTAVNQPGWREGRKIAGQAFAISSIPAEVIEGNKSLGQFALQNRESALRVLDNMIAVLHNIRQAIADGDEAGLHSLIERAQKGRKEWLLQRQESDWEAKPQTEAPSLAQILGRFVGLGNKKKR